MSLRSLLAGAAVAATAMGVIAAAPAVAAPSAAAALPGASVTAAAATYLKTNGAIAQTYGSSSYLNVEVHGGPAGATGKVRVYTGYSVIGEAYVSGGKATVRIAASVTPGTRKITAVYFGDRTHARSQRGGITFTVRRYDPAMSGGARTNVTYPNRSLVNVALAPINVSGRTVYPSGRVFVKTNGRTLVIIGLRYGKGSAYLPTLARGSYTIVAEYTGDYRFLPEAGSVAIRII